MAIYPWENAVLTWQHSEDLESATIKFYRHNPGNLLLRTQGDTVLSINEDYINRLTYSVRPSSSTMPMTLDRSRGWSSGWFVSVGPKMTLSENRPRSQPHRCNLQPDFCVSGLCITVHHWCLPVVSMCRNSQGCSQLQILH